MGSISKKDFDRFYRQQSEPLRKYIGFRVDNFETAEDLTQDAFVKMWTYNRQSDNDIKDLKNFLYQVARNLIADYYHKREQIPIPLPDLTGSRQSFRPDWNEMIDKKSKRRLVISHLLKLEGKYRRILSYRFIKDLSILEISQATKKSPNYVSVLIHEGVKKLKKQLISYP